MRMMENESVGPLLFIRASPRATGATRCLGWAVPVLEVASAGAAAGILRAAAVVALACLRERDFGVPVAVALRPHHSPTATLAADQYLPALVVGIFCHDPTVGLRVAIFAVVQHTLERQGIRSGSHLRIMHACMCDGSTELVSWLVSWLVGHGYVKTIKPLIELN